MLKRLLRYEAAELAISLVLPSVALNTSLIKHLQLQNNGLFLTFPSSAALCTPDEEDGGGAPDEEDGGGAPDEEELLMKKMVEELLMKRMVEELLMKRMVEELLMKRMVVELLMKMMVEELLMKRMVEELLMKKDWTLRLQQLDRHCQSSAQQVCELLAKQNQLMQERNTLTEEMQSLHTERRVATPST
ncbi:hypothetical protein NQZ68_003206 [Dissostichus eleginoides]|nr:hypothetical protein NQZ68_003206 [Dissostichus eleginoides]